MFPIRVFGIMANINSGTIFSFLPISAVSLAVTVYNTENVSPNPSYLGIFDFKYYRIRILQSPFDPIMMTWHMMGLVCGLFWPFLFCRFATMATERICEVADFTYDSDWFNLPVNLQKRIVLIISRSQEPIQFTGLNIFRCTLEVYGNV